MNIRTWRRVGRGVLASCALSLAACSPTYNRTLETTPTTREALILQRISEAREAQQAALAAIESLLAPPGAARAGDPSADSLAACEQRIWDARKSLASVEDVARPTAPLASADCSGADLNSLLADVRAAAASLEPLDVALQRRIADPASAPPLEPRLDPARVGARRFIVAADQYLAHHQKDAPLK